MKLIKNNLFWGYLDDKGEIIIKSYTNDRVIENTEKLPFCKGIFSPFEANNMFDAKLKCYTQLKGEIGINWRKKQ